MLCIFQGKSGKLPNIFGIIIPKFYFPKGCFPKRFEHESVSHELKVQVPYGHHEWMGIGLCVCFSVVEASKDFLLTCWIKVSGFESASPICSSFRANYVELVHVNFGGSICVLAILTPNGEKIFVKLMGMDPIKLRLE